MSRAQLTSTVEQSSGGVVAPFLAGKNKIINGDFAISQRGSSFSVSGSLGYTLDRWFFQPASGQTGTVTQTAFTPGAAPVAGYEGAYSLNLTTSNWTSGSYWLGQRIEDVRTFAGQTVTISFWAKATTANSSFLSTLTQNFGSGGSGGVDTSGSVYSMTTSWQRFTQTITLPSISGKTIGTGGFLEARILQAGGSTNSNTISIWGVQLEAGSVATPFTTASNTLQGELALCQRYLPVFTGGSLSGYAYATNGVIYSVKFPVQARVAPTSMVVVSQSNIYSLNTSVLYTPTFNLASTDGANIVGAITVTAGQGSRLEGGYIYFTGCEL